MQLTRLRRRTGPVADAADAAATFDLVSDGVALVDPAGVIRFWNVSAAEITGASRAEALGRAIDAVLIGWDALGEQLERPQTVIMQPTARGSVACNRGVIALAVRAQRVGSAWALAFRDDVAESELDRLKSDFLATVSHELRTPVTELYGAVTTLVHRYPAASGEAANLLAVVDEQAERLWKTVDRMVTMAALEVRRLAIAVRPIDPAAFLEQLLADARALAPPPITIQVAAASGLPPVLADPERLRQVMLCLLENAIAYSSPAGRISLGVDRGRDGARFRVQDDGIGLSGASLHHVFDAFYRADAAMTKGAGGSGLGLAIVRELTQQMGGTVQIESTAGAGVAVSVELPWAGTQPQAASR